jgi:succinate dehydrogenase / fumarate reductase membrane anchor subunit
MALSKTPLGRVRGLGSARHGTEHFWQQRLTSVAGLVLIPAFCVIAVLSVGRGHEQALALFAHPLVAILTILFVIATCLHMKIGMQVIVEDYLHAEGPKVLALMANTGFCVAVAVASIYAVLKIAFGA